MPKIFDNDTREDIRGQMLDNGFALIRRYGLKKTTIEDVTRASGVAKGTFYNFFKTKEEFVYQIVLYKRRLMRARCEEMLASNGGLLDRRLLRELLEGVIRGEYNLVAYLSGDDVALLSARWPKEYIADAEGEGVVFAWLLEQSPASGAGCDWKVFANLYHIAAAGIANRRMLYDEAMPDTVDRLIECLLDYAFESRPSELYAARR